MTASARERRWRDEAAHRASLEDPGTRAAIERGMPLIARFEGTKVDQAGGLP